ncbi:MAG: hypothetical protein ACTSVI_01070 [Promethearchaeota archaeon]
MSLNELIQDQQRRSLIKKAYQYFKSLNLDEKLIQGALELVTRLIFRISEGRLKYIDENHFIIALHLHLNRVSHVAVNNTDNEWLRARKLVMMEMKSNKTPSSLVDRICGKLSMVTWLDNSLRKWFLDMEDSFTSFMLQLIRRNIMKKITRSMLEGEVIIPEESIDEIIQYLLEKFPAMNKFTRHLSNAIRELMENEVLGVSIDKEIEIGAVESSIETQKAILDETGMLNVDYS